LLARLQRHHQKKNSAPTAKRDAVSRDGSGELGHGLEPIGPPGSIPGVSITSLPPHQTVPREGTDDEPNT
jgi:hypothetical protein